MDFTVLCPESAAHVPCKHDRGQTLIGLSSFHVLGHSLHSFFLSDELLMFSSPISFVEDAVS